MVMPNCRFYLLSKNAGILILELSLETKSEVTEILNQHDRLTEKMCIAIKETIYQNAKNNASS